MVTANLAEVEANKFLNSFSLQLNLLPPTQKAIDKCLVTQVDDLKIPWTNKPVHNTYHIL